MLYTSFTPVKFVSRKNLFLGLSSWQSQLSAADFFLFFNVDILNKIIWPALKTDLTSSILLEIWLWKMQLSGYYHQYRTSKLKYLCFSYPCFFLKQKHLFTRQVKVEKREKYIYDKSSKQNFQIKREKNTSIHVPFYMNRILRRLKEMDSGDGNQSAFAAPTCWLLQ